MTVTLPYILFFIFMHGCYNTQFTSSSIKRSGAITLYRTSGTTL